MAGTEELYLGSSSALQGIIDQLVELNSRFRTTADKIRDGHRKLDAMWEGPARESFRERFAKEEPTFEAFAGTVDDYVKALRTILEEIERGEAQNTATAARS